MLHQIIKTAKHEKKAVYFNVETLIIDLLFIVHGEQR